MYLIAEDLSGRAVLYRHLTNILSTIYVDQISCGSPCGLDTPGVHIYLDVWLVLSSLLLVGM